MTVTVTIVDHPVAAEALTHLRDENSSNQFFRAEMRRLSLVVIAEATRIVARVAKGGRLVLAGILVTQFPQVEAAYGKLGWKRIADCTEGEWKSASFELTAA